MRNLVYAILEIQNAFRDQQCPYDEGSKDITINCTVPNMLGGNSIIHRMEFSLCFSKLLHACEAHFTQLNVVKYRTWIELCLCFLPCHYYVYVSNHRILFNKSASPSLLQHCCLVEIITVVRSFFHKWLIVGIEFSFLFQGCRV